MCASIYTYVRDLGKVGVLFLKEHFPCINCINPYEMFIEQKKKDHHHIECSKIIPRLF